MSIFNPIVQRFNVSRNNHDLSHNHLYTMKMSRLTPVMCIPTMPGDKFQIGNIAIARFQPMYAPVMQRLKLKFTTFYVPYRALYDMWMKFIPSAGQYDLDPTKIKEFPVATWEKLKAVYEAKHGTLDYNSSQWCCNNLLSRFRYARTSKPLNIAPLIAYHLIWSEWFRNQNIQDEVDPDMFWKLEGNQDDNEALWDLMNGFQLKNVNWRQDYLTASQPWTQKGQEVIIPIEGQLPDFILKAMGSGQRPNVLIDQQGNIVEGTMFPKSYQYPAGMNGPFYVYADNLGNHGNPGENQNYYANVKDFASSSDLLYTMSSPITFQAQDANGAPVKMQTTLTINDLRWSNAIQKLLERRAAGGTRYVEYLLMEHATKLSDKVARRPEYVCGSSIPIQIGEVLQTSASESDSALGRLAGSGYAKGTAANGTYYCDEHGILMTLCWMMPQTAYMHGMPRYLTTTKPLDFPLPAFQHLGLQEVFNFEAGKCNNNDPDGVFGYMGRYDDMRTHLDVVSGNFVNNLKEWHMARNNQDVNLNNTFISASPGTINRVFNVTDTKDDDVLVNAHHHVVVKRNLSKYANPKL